jgi:DNA-binding Lrp family transcriptional regulator
MNQKEMKILSHLRNNSRIGLTKLSRETQIPVSTIFDKIKALEESVVMRHTSLLDFQKLGYSTRANISIKVDRNDRDGLRDYLVKNQYVNSVYKINNGFDFMFEGIFKEIKEMEDFVELLETKFKILEHKSYFIIEDIKREDFMSNPNLIGIY